LELLQGADIQFTRSNRLDVALVRNHPIALVFLPAADIPRFVGEGNIDLGITGEFYASSGRFVLIPKHRTRYGSSQPKAAVQKLSSSEQVAEAGLSDLIQEALPLGFGKCKLQVQVPERSDIKELKDLVGRKVVTSFENVASRYFGQLDRESGSKTAIERIGGSVEAACALGLADGIVDLVGE
jgi:ATP phosphoribosyltransferase